MRVLRRLFAPSVIVQTGDRVRIVGMSEVVELELPRNLRDEDLSLHVRSFLSQCGYSCNVLGSHRIQVSQQDRSTSVDEVMVSLLGWVFLARGG